MRDNKRNAGDSAFGWQFQVSAAIRLMLEKLREYKIINVEGPVEDIEINTKKGELILVQVKSKVAPYYDPNIESKSVYNSAQKAKLKRALNGFVDCDNTNYSKLIYLTNSSYPFCVNENFEWGDCEIRNYNELRPHERKIVDDIINPHGVDESFRNKLFFQVIQYERLEDFNTVNKKLLNCIECFLRTLDIPDSYSKEYLEKIFILCNHDATYETFSRSDEEFVALALTIDSFFRQEVVKELSPDVDSLYHIERIGKQYREYIDKYSRTMRVSLDVLSKYNSFVSIEKSLTKRILEFVREKNTILDEILPNDIDKEEREALKKCIIYQIVTKKNKFEKAKKEYLKGYDN